jgi:putative membrane protein
MKPILLFLLLLLGSITLLPGADAAPAPVPPSSLELQPHTLGRALLYMLLFAASGIVVAIVGYKLFDLFTPGDLHNEIIEKQNVAAAIVAAAIVLGVCIIIAAAMIG